ncbi:MAG: hypothetical protein IPK84_03545 [Candidatus Moraniibacteriota bacterium]|nr:MAG: hypothetical protein IPK84_03545 [Candidatus Moranbacteria bacterium]
MIQTFETANVYGRVSVLEQDGLTFVVHTLRKKQVSSRGDFVVAKVLDQYGQILWLFPKSFQGLALLKQVGDEAVIALVERGREGRVMEVIAFSSLGKDSPVDLHRSIRLKRLAAQHLEREYYLTDAEAASVMSGNKPEPSRRQMSHAARRQAWMESARCIRGRHSVTVRSEDGRVLSGIPVVGNEWRYLKPGTYAVTVERFDDASGLHEKPIEAFKVVTDRQGKLVRTFVTPVAPEWRPDNVVRPSAMEGAIRKMTVCNAGDGENLKVLVYASMDDIRKARGCGLGGGTYVTSLDKRQADDRWTVFRVYDGKIETIGNLGVVR